MTIIMPSTAKLTFPPAFNKKNTGTPTRVAAPKQSNCLFVKLKKIFDFTRVKSRGTGIYATNSYTSLLGIVNGHGKHFSQAFLS